MGKIRVERGIGKNNPYDMVLNNFRNDLDVLKELNSKLAETIERMKEETKRLLKQNFKVSIQTARRNLRKSLMQ